MHGLKYHNEAHKYIQMSMDIYGHNVIVCVCYFLCIIELAQ